MCECVLCCCSHVSHRSNFPMVDAAITVCLQWAHELSFVCVLHVWMDGLDGLCACVPIYILIVIAVCMYWCVLFACISCHPLLLLLLLGMVMVNLADSWRVEFTPFVWTLWWVLYFNEHYDVAHSNWKFKQKIAYEWHNWDSDWNWVLFENINF